MIVCVGAQRIDIGSDRADGTGRDGMGRMVRAASRDGCFRIHPGTRASVVGST